VGVTLFLEVPFRQLWCITPLIDARWGAGDADLRRCREYPSGDGGKSGNSTIPIVFLAGVDPVTRGLVASFNRPGGNATGVSFLTTALEAKRLGLLHELLPRATAIAALMDPNFLASAGQLKDLQDAARTLSQQIYVLEASTDSQIDKGFASLAYRSGRSEPQRSVPEGVRTA
jgi:hypothetical protein